MTDLPLVFPEGQPCNCGELTVVALQFSVSRGRGNGGPPVQVSSLGPNERHLNAINVPVFKH